MEAVRVLNCKDPDYRGQQWQGSALEYICADFLSGVDPRALRVLDSMEIAIQEKVARVEGKMTKRRQRKIRAAVRDELAEKLGLFKEEDPEEEPEEEEVEEEEVEEEKPEEEEDEGEEDDESDEEEETIEDGGRLFESVSQTMEDYDGGDTFKYELAESLTPRILGLWTTGYLLKILGDERTEQNGERPEVYLWISDEDDENVIDLSLEYSDLYDELLDVTLEVVEMLPAEWNDYGPDEEWEAPHVADSREVLPG
jgi:hypothetical protein